MSPPIYLPIVSHKLAWGRFAHNIFWQALPHFRACCVVDQFADGWVEKLRLGVSAHVFVSSILVAAVVRWPVENFRF
jgi:hypothetical protein